MYSGQIQSRSGSSDRQVCQAHQPVSGRDTGSHCRQRFPSEAAGPGVRMNGRGTASGALVVQRNFSETRTDPDRSGNFGEPHLCLPDAGRAQEAAEIFKIPPISADFLSFLLSGQMEVVNRDGAMLCSGAITASKVEECHEAWQGAGVTIFLVGASFAWVRIPACLETISKSSGFLRWHEVRVEGRGSPLPRG